MIIEEQIQKGSYKPRFCKVDKRYIQFMHKIDSRVSVKYNNRPFVILTIYINNNLYAVPLTSTTNRDRLAAGKKPRSNLITTKIIVQNVEIADLLYNNMFPVIESVLTDLHFNPLVDTFEINEERFIRKNWGKINAKAMSVYLMRYNTEGRNYHLLNKLCCDFKELEKSVSSFV